MSDNIFRAHKEISSDKPTRFYSSKQEKDVAKAVGGQRTKNSGAVMFDKGDVKSNPNDAAQILYECKTQTKDKNQFTIKKEWFEKNKQEMVFTGKDYSVIVFNFGPSSENYYIIDENTFKEFLDYLNGDK